MISSERITFKLSSFPSGYMQDFDEFWKQKKATDSKREYPRGDVSTGDGDTSPRPLFGDFGYYQHTFQGFQLDACLLIRTYNLRTGIISIYGLVLLRRR